MKKLLISFVVALSCYGLVSAHPGDTDVYGCHTCYTNCADRGLSYWQYHCHADTTTTSTPTSYAKYAPVGACQEEIDKIPVLEQELVVIEQSSYTVKDDIKSEYDGKWISKSYFNNILQDRLEKISSAYNAKYREYESAFNTRKSCLEKAWFENYLKIQKDQAEKQFENALQLAQMLCTNTYGSNAKSNDDWNCICIDWYIWNTKKTSCIVKPPEKIIISKPTTTKRITTKTTVKTSTNSYKAKYCKNAKKWTDGQCYCKSWYILSKTWKACIKGK